MNADTVDWLVREVHDLLDVSSVGLYEFMWMLNTPDQELSSEERKALARRALERLLAEPGVELTRMRWPEWEAQGNLRLDELPDDPWQDPDEDGQYIALNRS